MRLVQGEGRLDGPNAIIVSTAQGRHRLRPHRGRHPRDLGRRHARACCRPPCPTASASSPGPSSTTSTQIPEHLIVVGSGVTGAEFASAYRALGAKVTLISSRDQVLPGEDADAASVIEKVFKRNGMKVLNKSRAESVVRDGDGGRRHPHRRPRGARQPLPDGGRLHPEHRRHRPRGGRRAAHRERAHPGQPRRAHLDAEHLRRRRLHRRSCRSPPSPRCRAARPCSTRWATSSNPPELRNITSNIFTQPEIATVGWTAEGDRGGRRARRRLQAAARVEPARQDDGHPRRLREALRPQRLRHRSSAASSSRRRPRELIFPLALAVEHRLTVDQFAEAFPVYPSLTGSLTDAARAMHVVR